MSAVAPITVLIPVGPEPRHRTYLMEALESIKAQTVLPDEVLIMDDMAGLKISDVSLPLVEVPHLRIWNAPWNIGNVGAVNCGVALAKNECVIVLASDDLLHSRCVEMCERIYNPLRYPLAYYWFDIQLMGKENYIQRVVSGPSMLTKTLWKYIGGYPLEAAVGHSDAFLVNIMMARTPEVELVRVEPEGMGSDPPAMYTARLIDDNDRYIRLATGWDTIIDAVKNLATQNWKKPAWGRM